MKKQKNISWMYIRYSMLSSVSIALICTIVYVWKSEQQVYDLLWKESIASVPIGLFIMTTSLLIGGDCRICNRLLYRAAYTRIKYVSI